MLRCGILEPFPLDAFLGVALKLFGFSTPLSGVLSFAAVVVFFAMRGHLVMISSFPGVTPEPPGGDEDRAERGPAKAPGSVVMNIQGSQGSDASFGSKARLSLAVSLLKTEGAGIPEAFTRQLFGAAAPEDVEALLPEALAALARTSWAHLVAHKPAPATSTSSRRACPAIRRSPSSRR